MYGTDEGFQAYLDTFGYTLPPEAPSAAILRARGSAYLDAAYEPLWTGNRTDPTQDDAWPRSGAVINCTVAIDESVVPTAVVNAAYRAAWLEAETTGILSASFQSGLRVKRQRVEGAVEREFFDDGQATVGSGAGGFVDTAIDGMMQQFICKRAGGFLFKAIG